MHIRLTHHTAACIQGTYRFAYIFQLNHWCSRHWTFNFELWQVYELRFCLSNEERIRLKSNSAKQIVEIYSLYILTVDGKRKNSIIDGPRSINVLFMRYSTKIFLEMSVTFYGIHVNSIRDLIISAFLVLTFSDTLSSEVSLISQFSFEN